MLDKVQPDAADDGYFVCGDGTKEFLHGYNLVGDLCGGVKNVSIYNLDDLSL